MHKILLGYLLCVNLLLGQEVPDTSSKEPTQVHDVIQVSDVTQEGSLLLRELKKLNDNLVEDEEAHKISLKIKPYVEELQSVLESENYVSIDFLNVRELQKMQGETSSYLKQLFEWSEFINVKLKEYDSDTQDLAKWSLLWHNSYDNAKEKNVPQELLTHINSVVQEISLVQKILKLNYDSALKNAQLLSSKSLRLKELNGELKERELLVNSRVFHQNQASLFSLTLSDDFSLYAYIKKSGNSLFEKYEETLEYLKTNREYWVIYSVMALASGVFVFYYNYLYRRRKLFVIHTSVGKKIFFFIGRPVSTYLILLILLTVLIFPERLSAFSEMILLLLLVPVMRILQTVISKQEFKYIYALVGLRLISVFINNAVGFEFVDRIAMVLLNLVLLLYIVMVLKNGLLKLITRAIVQKIAKGLLYLFVFILVVAIFANINGYVLLSSRIIEGVVNVLLASSILYALYVILTGYIVVMLRRRIASASHMLEKYAQKIEKSTCILIQVWMILWWLLIVIKLLSAYPYLVTFHENVMALSWSIAQTVISVEAIVSFVLIVFGTWLVARLTQTVLEVEVFARFRLPRGMPTAILTTLNYVIIITGTVIAFSSVGVTAQQFALIFGALGVGIGFGLRNIIANFVSGVIMVFERPVQIGDTIQVDKTLGNVQSIGARSSTIKTFDGSEVIIPNADFIAKEIVNWTLSDEQRRRTVTFKVDLDNEIEEILEIMKNVAMAHKDVLKSPEPLAAFKSFGEYYLEFKLYFWLSDNLIVAPSEVTLNLFKALKEAGVTMPVPKTNVQKSE